MGSRGESTPKSAYRRASAGCPPDPYRSRHEYRFAPSQRELQAEYVIPLIHIGEIDVESSKLWPRILGTWLAPLDTKWLSAATQTHEPAKSSEESSPFPVKTEFIPHLLRLPPQTEELPPDLMYYSS